MANRNMGNCIVCGEHDEVNRRGQCKKCYQREYRRGRISMRLKTGELSVFSQKSVMTILRRARKSHKNLMLSVQHKTELDSYDIMQAIEVQKLLDMI